MSLDNAQKQLSSLVTGKRGGALGQPTTPACSIVSKKSTAWMMLESVRIQDRNGR